VVRGFLRENKLEVWCFFYWNFEVGSGTKRKIESFERRNAIWKMTRNCEIFFSSFGKTDWNRLVFLFFLYPGL
jgi:hypothetical protein